MKAYFVTAQEYLLGRRFAKLNYQIQSDKAKYIYSNDQNFQILKYVTNVRHRPRFIVRKNENEAKTSPKSNIFQPPKNVLTT